MGGVAGEILDFPGVALGIEEFFRGAVGIEVEGLERRQLALGLDAPEFVHRLTDFLVGHLAGLIDAGCLVAHVAEAVVAHGAHLVEALIHEVAEGVGVFRRVGRGRQEAMSVIFGRDGDAGERQRRRGEVDPAGEVLADRARGDLTGPADDERDAGARVLHRTLVARHAAAVVAGQDDDGVLFEVVGLQPVEDAAEGIVHRRDEFMVMRDLAADDRGVGIEGREFDLGGIAAVGRLKGGGILGVLLIVGAHLALVADRVVEVSEERFLGLGGQRAGRTAGRVDPVLAIVREVLFGHALEVGLTGPHHVITGGLKFLGERVGWIDDHRTHVLGAILERILAGDHAAARGGADAGVGEGPGEARAFLGEAIHVGRDRVLAAVGASVWAHVFTDHHHDVGASLGGAGEGGGKDQDRKGKTTKHGGGTTTGSHGCGLSSQRKKKGRI